MALTVNLYYLKNQQIETLTYRANHVQLVLSHLFLQTKGKQIETLSNYELLKDLQLANLHSISLMTSHDAQHHMITIRSNPLIENYLIKEKIKYWRYGLEKGSLLLVLFELNDDHDRLDWNQLYQQLQNIEGQQECKYYNLWGIATTYVNFFTMTNLTKWQFVDGKRQANKAIVNHNDESDRLLLPIGLDLGESENQALINLQDLFFELNDQDFQLWIKTYQKQFPTLCDQLTYNWPKQIWPLRFGRPKTNYETYPHHQPIIKQIFENLTKDKISINDVARAYLHVFQTVNIDHVTYIKNEQNGLPFYQPLNNETQQNENKFSFWNDYQSLLNHIEIKLQEKELKKKTLDCTINNYRELCEQIYKMSRQVAFKSHHYLVYENGVFNCQAQRQNPDGWQIEKAWITPKHYAELERILKQKRLYIINTMGRNYYQFDDENSLHISAKRRVDHFLKQIFSNDETKINIYFEFIGYGCLANTDLRKALIIKGDGKNGKSTLINFTKRFLNPDSLALLPVSRLGDEYAKVELQYKTLWFDTEGPAYLDDGIDDLKAIISGDEISSNVKYQHPRKWRSTTTMIVATNNQINFRQYSSAIGDRLYFMNLTNRFDKAKEKINQILLDDLFGFDEKQSDETNRLNEQATLAYCDYLILNGIKRVIDQNHQPTTHQEHTKMLNHFEATTHPVLTWLIEENYLLFSDEPERYINYSDAYLELIKTKNVRSILNEFKKWAEENGYGNYHINVKNLKTIMESYGAVDETKKINEQGRQENWFVINNHKWKTKTGADFVNPGGDQDESKAN